MKGITLRKTILKYALKTRCPDGDLKIFEKFETVKISCVFIFYQRYDLMENILHCLNSQDLKKSDFETIIVEDKGGSKKGKALYKKFNEMNISYFAPDHGWGKMGFMRNFGLSKSKGEIVLFLDDDTVIADNHFLSGLYAAFHSNKKPDAVMPHGFASFSLLEARYAFHDPFFFTNRCMAYKRSCLKLLKGFDSSFIGQEDVELAIRFLSKDFKVVKSSELVYFHPPLILTDTSKSYAVGASFARSKYPFWFKCLLLINGARWFPLYLIPGPQNRHKAKFALGFLKGFILSLFQKDTRVEYR